MRSFRIWMSATTSTTGSPSRACRARAPRRVDAHAREARPRRCRARAAGRALGRPAPAHRARPQPRGRARHPLLDEPLGALDANLRKPIQDELKLLQRNVGITFIFVTHAQSEALILSDRIVVMNQRPHRADREAPRALHAAEDASSSPASSAGTRSSPERVERADGDARSSRRRSAASADGRTER